MKTSEKPPSGRYKPPPSQSPNETWWTDPRQGLLNSWKWGKLKRICCQNRTMRVRCKRLFCQKTIWRDPLQTKLPDDLRHRNQYELGKTNGVKNHSNWSCRGHIKNLQKGSKITKLARCPRKFCPRRTDADWPVSSLCTTSWRSNTLRSTERTRKLEMSSTSPRKIGSLWGMNKNLVLVD